MNTKSLSLLTSSVSFSEQHFLLFRNTNFVVFREVNDVFAVYLVHRNVKATFIWKVKFYQVQNKDD